MYMKRYLNYLIVRSIIVVIVLLVDMHVPIRTTLRTILEVPNALVALQLLYMI